MGSALELRGIVKTFGAVRANDGVDLAVEWGQVHALLGENGAGKSTLMNVLYGLVRPDAGQILLDGSPVRIAGPDDAIRRGIGMVHQHFMLIPVLTVAENVVLGHEESRQGVLDAAAARRDVDQLSARYGLEVPPGTLVRDLSVGLQQRVEILKALYRGARLLILDEPTAVLTPQEIERLFEIVRGLKAEGKAVIFITHKLGEVMAIADQITVMRRGKVVATTVPGETSPADLASKMVGRPVLLRVEKGPAHPAGVVLRLDGLSVNDERGQPAVRDVSLEVRAGEILGVAGVSGNGQSELVEAVIGLRPVVAGRIELQGKDVTHSSTHRRLEHLSHIPADRHRMGAILEMPIFDNVVMETFDRRPFARGLIRMLDPVRRFAARVIKEFDIRAESPDEPMGSLSGGNQQKVVVGRELSTEPAVLLAAEPTRGVDVGSIEFIHRQLIRRRDAGLGVLLVSSELDEVLSLSDRVAVIYRGRIVAVLDSEEADRDRVGLLMAGAA
ncbi:MAG TPA: ABC transporter ATP-binding protein [Candidatus Dormibacteraeota bacterium]